MIEKRWNEIKGGNMRKIYKILISVFTILILTSTIGIAAKPTPTPNPEQVQDERITTLETNDTVQLQNNTQQDQKITSLFSQIDDILGQINLMIDRVTNLENSPYPAIYSASENYTTITEPWTWTELNRLTIDLPKDTYVNVEASGSFHMYGGFAITTLDIDGTQKSWSGYNSGSGSNGQWSGFQNRATVYLTAGQHDIKLSGRVTTLGSLDITGAAAEITATAFDKGMIYSRAIQSTEQLNNIIDPIKK